jgi:hypothetical protein
VPRREKVVEGQGEEEEVEEEEDVRPRGVLGR